MATLDAAAGQSTVRGETLRIDWPTPLIALVTFERAVEMNSLSLAMISELEQALAIVAQHRPAALILTGSGQAFCAGADLKLLADPDSVFVRSPVALRDQYLAPLASLFDSFEEMPFPIIAAINGFALGGGCEMALSADLRIISRTASIGLPEVHLGAIPGAGGVQKLIRHVGRSKALEWILLGARIPAAEAERWGLVAEVTEPDRLLERALDLAGRLAKAGGLAIAQAKASIYVAEDVDLRTARKFGLEALALLASTDEWHEGVRAFIEKRAPRFR
jgi:enoyl-CoA hydratase/carnithine racemase